MEYEAEEFVDQFTAVCDEEEIQAVDFSECGIQYGRESYCE